MGKKDLECFLSLVNYFGHYIHNFSDITEPLQELHRCNVTFVWGMQHQEAFDKLKQALHEYPIVQSFDVQKDTVLTMDASKKSVSAILSQDDHPVMHLSRRLTDAEQKYSKIEKEALTIIWATSRARHYLIGKKFLVAVQSSPTGAHFQPSASAAKSDFSQTYEMGSTALCL